MAEPVEHKDCRDNAQMVADSIDFGVLDVTTVEHPDAETVRCPHGVRFWLVPVETT